MRPPDPNAPSDLRDLSQGSRALIWLLRGLISGQGGCPAMSCRLDSLFGPLAIDVRSTGVVFLRLVETRGRRKLAVGFPGCLSLTRDEQSLLAAFEAAQRRESARLDAHLSWLLAGPAADLFAQVMGGLAQAFAARSLVFGEPSAAASVPAPQEPARARA